MPTTLTIELPDDLRTRLERRAEANHRSLDDEVIRVLKTTVATEGENPEAIWKRIDRLREEGPTIDLDPTEMKRLMREGLA